MRCRRLKPPVVPPEVAEPMLRSSLPRIEFPQPGRACATGARRRPGSGWAGGRRASPAPGSPARRSPRITAFTSGRSARGSSCTSIRPWLIEAGPPAAPTEETTVSTCGEAWMSSATRPCIHAIASREVPRGPSVPTLIRPVSSTGKKPLGSATASHAAPPSKAGRRGRRPRGGRSSRRSPARRGRWRRSARARPRAAPARSSPASRGRRAARARRARAREGAAEGGNAWGDPADPHLRRTRATRRGLRF